MKVIDRFPEFDITKLTAELEQAKRERDMFKQATSDFERLLLREGDTESSANRRVVAAIRERDGLRAAHEFCADDKATLRAHVERLQQDNRELLVCDCDGCEWHHPGKAMQIKDMVAQRDAARALVRRLAELLTGVAKGYLGETGGHYAECPRDYETPGYKETKPEDCNCGADAIRVEVKELLAAAEQELANVSACGESGAATKSETTDSQAQPTSAAGLAHRDGPLELAKDGGGR